VELACAVTLMATLASVAVPPLLAGLDEFRTSGAARHVAARLQRARMDARQMPHLSATAAVE